VSEKKGERRRTDHRASNMNPEQNPHPKKKRQTLSRMNWELEDNNSRFREISRFLSMESINTPKIKGGLYQDAG
jgi:hypothetical protein